MTKKKFLPIIFATLLLLTIRSSTCNTRTPGVNVGDWFIFGNIQVKWNSTDPTQTCPNYLLEMNETEWIRIDVQSVVGTNVTGQLIQHFKNATEIKSTGWVNVDTGDGENLTMAIVAANLTVGEPIYASVYYSAYTINETIIRTYPEGQRETNHINITTEQTFPGGFYINVENYYWDKTTGVIVEMRAFNRVVMGENVTEMSMSLEIVDSKAWVIPEFSTSPSILLLFSALPFIMVFIKRRKMR